MLVTFGCKKNSLEPTSTGAESASSPQRPPMCFQHEDESRPTTFARNLVVHINNSCRYRIDCTMTTDANDKEFSIAVPAHGNLNLMVEANTQTREFRADFQCTWER